LRIRGASSFSGDRGVGVERSVAPDGRIALRCPTHAIEVRRVALGRAADLVVGAFAFERGLRCIGARRAIPVLNATLRERERRENPCRYL
jgi:hypothetical protein